MIVKHNQLIDNLREQIEQHWKKKFHAAQCIISNGEVIFEYFAGAEDDSATYPILKVCAAELSNGVTLPPDWKEIAEQWVLGGISIKRVEKLLKCSLIMVPEEFFDYAQSVYNDYYEYMAENAEDPYYM